MANLVGYMIDRTFPISLAGLEWAQIISALTYVAAECEVNEVTLAHKVLAEKLSGIVNEDLSDEIKKFLNRN